MEFMKLNIQYFASTNKTIYDSYGNPYTLSMSVSETIPSDYVTTNKTKISGTVSVSNTGAGGAYDANKTMSATMVIRDTNSSGSVLSTQTGSCAFDFQGNPTKTATPLSFSGVEITHNADGTKTIYCDVTLTISATSLRQTAYINTTMALTTIPRKSSFTASGANIGAVSAININSASSSFRHTITYSFGSLSDTIATNVISSYNWTIPTSFYAQIPNSKTGTCTLTVITYSGNTELGRSSGTITVGTSEEACRPTITGSVVDINTETRNLTGNPNKLVKFKSDAVITATATAKNSASISRTTIEGGTTNPLTIYGVSKNSFALTTTDSRGYPNSATASASGGIVNYVELTCNANFYRTTQTGSEIKVKYTGNYFNGSFGSQNNSLTLSWKYREQGSSTWLNGGSLTPTISGNTYSGEISVGSSYDYQKGYEFIVYFADKLSSLNTGSILVTKGQGSLEIYNGAVKIGGEYLTGGMLSNYEPKFIYNSTGTASWYKILHLPATGNYSGLTIQFSIHLYNRNTYYANCCLQYYNNSSIEGRIISGDILSSELKYIKNSDNTIDVYYHNQNTYAPTVVTVLSFYHLTASVMRSFDIFEGTGAISGTPSGTLFAQLGTISYARMRATGSRTYGTSETLVTFNEGFGAREYSYDSANNRLLIDYGTAHIKIGAKTCGRYNASVYIYIRRRDNDSDVYHTWFVFQGNGLGNSYWSMPVVDDIATLNPQYQYYVRMYAAGYNGQNFNMNDGFSAIGTTVYVEKID